jgi:phosphoglucosamine mutase
MGKFFGTDGIRGVANQHPMTAELALGMGRAVALLFRRHGASARIVIGKDTRISGDMLEQALCAGICSMGGTALIAGVLPTPAIAYLTVLKGADAGLVVSASHNPYEDNGIKVFDANGFKIGDELESRIEALLGGDQLVRQVAAIRALGTLRRLPQAQTAYVDFLRATLSDGQGDLARLKVVLDCAHGATFEAAPQLFASLGMQTTVLFNTPDGTNINAGCGSQHPEKLASRVVQEKADLGLAFDGDGDRLICVDERGEILTGDQVLAICAKAYKAADKLDNDLLVSTVMSNIGLGLALRQMGIRHCTAPVGDRHVMEMMKAEHAVIGGENSGHLIFLDHHSTGDGLLAALRLMEAMLAVQAPLSELKQIMQVFPQAMINVDVSQKPPLATVPAIQSAILAIEKALGDRGRVLVRYSGTQSKCRVMVEGPDLEETQRHCRFIAAAVTNAIGV